MKPLEEPIASIVAGRPAEIDLRGSRLLASRLLTKDLAFRQGEREAFGLRGLLPDRVQTMEEQVELEWEHLSRKEDALEQYIGLAALQDRNATLFYGVLSAHLEELMPVVYTPTVGQACQQFSHILRRARGIWITPDDIDRVPQVLRNSPYTDVRLIVVTDNERILGLGDQGAGGMGIPVGKLALYSACGGLHPSLTLPVSLDVGTDNRTLLNDPLYMGYRARRLRGQAYQELVEAFVHGVAEVWPGCVIQWEDFKGPNALRILDHFRNLVPSFNDDVQGTAATAVAGVYAAARRRSVKVTDLRFVLAGAGAAGVGITRLLRRALQHEGLSDEEIDPRIALLDSRGLVHSGRTDLDEFKREVAIPAERVHQLGLTLEGDGPTRLCEVIRAVRPDVLIGTTGQPGSFDQYVIHEMTESTEEPVDLRSLQPLQPGGGDAGRDPGLERGASGRGHGQPLPAGVVEGRAPADRAGQQRLRLPRRRSGRGGSGGPARNRGDVPGRRPHARRAGARGAAGGGRYLPLGRVAGRYLARGGHLGRARGRGLRRGGDPGRHGPGRTHRRGHVAPRLRALYPISRVSTPRRDLRRARGPQRRLRLGTGPQGQASKSRQRSTVSLTTAGPVASYSTVSVRLGTSPQPASFSTASHEPRVYLYSSAVPSSKGSVIDQVSSSTRVMGVPPGSQPWKPPAM